MNNTKNRISICILTYILAFFIAYGNPSNKARTFDMKDGLPSINISLVRQDDKGLIWIGTWNGLSFFNGERFYTFRSDELKGKLSTNRIQTLQPDKLNNIWFLTYDRKLNLLDKDKGRLMTISEFLPEGTVVPSIRDLYRSKDAIWAVSIDGNSLVKISYNQKSPHGYNVEVMPTSALIPGSQKFRGIKNGMNGDSWIVTDKKTFLEGSSIEIPGEVVEIIEEEGKSFLVTVDGRISSISGRQVKEETHLKDFGRITGAVKINNSNIGVSTIQGYAVYNTKTKKWQRYKAEGGVNKIFADSNNRIWMFGGNGEILMASGTSTPVSLAFEESSKPGTIFFMPLIFEDRFGTVWLAQENGQLGYYDEAVGKIVPKPVIVPKLKYNALPMVERYFIDKSGDLWLISSSGLSFVNFTYNNFKNLPIEENYETRSVLVTRDGSLLAGSVNGVLSKYAPDGKFAGYLSHTPIVDGSGRLVVTSDYKRFSNRIYALHEDNKGNIWIGTKESGLYMIAPDNRVFHYSPQQSGEGHLDSDIIYGFDTDTKGRLWVATYGKGPFLATLNEDGKASFTALAELPGYPKEDSFKQVRRITHNKDGLIVMSTNSGLLMLNDDFKKLSDIKFSTVTPDFSNKESLATANVMQTLFSKHGYALVTPMGGEVQRIDNNDLASGNLKFHNPASEELSRVLSRGNVQAMTEDQDGNFYFVRDTDIVRYSPSDSTINILGSGVLGEDYEFTEGLPAVGPDGNLYFCTLGSVVKLNPQNMNKEIAPPSIIFTSMQTPEKGQERLLIPSEKIVIEPGNRDFSLSFTSVDYMGVGQTEYAYRFGEYGQWNYIGTDNTIRISGIAPGDHRLYIKSTNADGTWCDNEEYIDIEVKPRFGETIWAKLLWLLLILIFIGAGVWIYTSQRRNRLMNMMRQREHDFYVNASHKLRTPLSLIGSPVYEVLKTEKLSEVGREHLERVRRSAKNMLNVLNSMLESEFKASGLYDPDTAESSVAMSDERPSYMTSENWLEAKDNDEDDHKQDITILIVEDNDDLRGFLRDILQSRYNVLTAANGKEGLAIAESGQPDFILTDVTMPEMDGLTMVKKIKSHKELSHIPIIVLSAKTSMDDKMEGLRAGIDDYISKPFSATYLRQRIANIIAQRAMLQRSFMEKLGSRMSQGVEDRLASAESDQPSGDAVASEQTEASTGVERQEYRLSAPQIIEEDHLMMEKLMKFIEERIGDENLKIDDMADAVGMGRTVFYGKIKAIVGMAPSDFLRTLRMQRAEELIVRSNMTFSQVSFSIGFSDPKYFTKCFKKETGMTPSEYRKLKRDSEASE